jgi:hypothetical protein
MRLVFSMMGLSMMGLSMMVAIVAGCGPQVALDDDDGGSSSDGASTGEAPDEPVPFSTTVPAPESGDGTSGDHPGACGNSRVDPGEDCDGANLVGMSCASLGLGDGQLSCDDACGFDTSQCVSTDTCGNGMVERGEQCDGADLQGYTCMTLGQGTGRLACDATCAFDLSGCEPSSETCGNGGLEFHEPCDGDINPYTCEDLGYDGGDIGCTRDCQLDTSACLGAVCGNGTVDPGEQCDLADLQGFDCDSLGLGTGTLACELATCTYDTSGCMP